MIEVRMSEEHGIDLPGRDGKGSPIALAQLLVALEQSAIDQDPPITGIEKIFGTGHGPRAAEEA